MSYWDLSIILLIWRLLDVQMCGEHDWPSYRLGWMQYAMHLCPWSCGRVDSVTEGSLWLGITEFHNVFQMTALFLEAWINVWEDVLQPSFLNSLSWDGFFTHISGDNIPAGGALCEPWSLLTYPFSMWWTRGGKGSTDRSKLISWLWKTLMYEKW